MRVFTQNTCPLIITEIKDLECKIGEDYEGKERIYLDESGDVKYEYYLKTKNYTEIMRDTIYAQLGKSYLNEIKVEKKIKKEINSDKNKNKK